MSELEKDPHYAAVLEILRSKKIKSGFTVMCFQANGEKLGFNLIDPSKNPSANIIIIKEITDAKKEMARIYIDNLNNFIKGDGKGELSFDKEVHCIVEHTKGYVVYDEEGTPYKYVFKEEEHENIVGRKLRIVENLEDHIGYKGQELEILEELENGYIMVTDGKQERMVGIEETDLFL